MSAKLVPTIKTVYDSKQMIKGFIEGWKLAFEIMPKKEQIAVLWAQWSLETGGGQSCFNNNLGNVKFVASNNPDTDTGKQYMMLANVWEISGGKKIIFQPPHTATWFRSFDTLGEGVSYHLGFLRNKRYKTAWTAVEAGNPAAFAHLLRLAGYYTAPESDYTRLMNNYFNKFMKEKTFEQIIEKLQVPDPAPVPPVIFDLLPEPEPTTQVVIVTEPEPITDPVPQPVVAPTNIFKMILELIKKFLNKK